MGGKKGIRKKTWCSLTGGSLDSLWILAMKQSEAVALLIKCYVASWHS